MASEHGYTTDSQVKTLIPLLDDIYSTENELDDFITYAERDINSDLSALFSVPFTGTIPGKVTNLAIKLSAYYALKGKFMKDNQNDNEWVKSFKNEYDEEIEKILNREISLFDGTDDEVSEKGDLIQSSTSSYTATFGVDDIEDATVDGDQLDDIADDRDD